MNNFIMQHRVAIGNWYNFTVARPLLRISKTYFVKSTNKNSNCQNICFQLFVLCILLIISSDIHKNPGPTQRQDKEISLCSVNVRSLCPSDRSLKIDEIHTSLCLDKSCDIICISETWLDSSISDEEIKIPDYEVVRKDRNRRGGGVAIYFHESLPVKNDWI